jgi:hypothetical protein
MEIANSGPRPFDLHILYLGADYTIVHILSERIYSGDRLEEGLIAFTDTSFGREQLVTIVTEAEALSAVEDFRYFESSNPESILAMGAGDDDGPSPLGQLLRAIAKGEGGPTFEIDKGVMEAGSVSIQRFDVLP